MDMDGPIIRKNEEAAGQPVQLVGFKLDREEYAVPAGKITEIIRLPSVTRVPNAPRYIDGVINIRGKVIPVVSMRKRFGLADGENSRSTRVMVVDMADELIGLVVDAVSEVIRAAASDISPPPSLAADGIGQECVTGVISKGGRLLLLLDPEKMLTADENMMVTGPLDSAARLSVR